MIPVNDFNGLDVAKGDMVAPLTGDFRGRVAEVKTIDGEGFVCIRPSHRPYSKGIWYASEHVQRIQRPPPTDDKDKKRPGAAAASAEKPASKVKVKVKAKTKPKSDPKPKFKSPGRGR